MKLGGLPISLPITLPIRKPAGAGTRGCGRVRASRPRNASPLRRLDCRQAGAGSAARPAECPRRLHWDGSDVRGELGRSRGAAKLAGEREAPPSPGRPAGSPRRHVRMPVPMGKVMGKLIGKLMGKVYNSMFSLCFSMKSRFAPGQFAKSRMLVLIKKD